MASPYIKSLDELKQFILRDLGAPVITIELTDDQLTDCINNTIEEYLPEAYSGVIERFIPLTLDPLYNSYILPYSVFAITAIHSVDSQGISGGAPSNLFSMNQFIAADLYNPGTAKMNLVGYEAVNEMIETMGIMFAKKLTYDFNSISKILHLFAPNQGEKIMIQCFKKMDLEGTAVGNGKFAEENIYNEKWIKRMACAKAKKQWGWNLIKYNGSILPNGGSLNAEFIYNDGKDAVEKLAIELQENYSLPVDFFVA